MTYVKYQAFTAIPLLTDAQDRIQATIYNQVEKTRIQEKNHKKLLTVGRLVVSAFVLHRNTRRKAKRLIGEICSKIKLCNSLVSAPTSSK